MAQRTGRKRQSKWLCVSSHSMLLLVAFIYASLGIFIFIFDECSSSLSSFRYKVTMKTRTAHKREHYCGP